MAEDQEAEAVVMEEGGENLVLCLGNLLNSASQKVTAGTNAPEATQTQVKDSVSSYEIQLTQLRAPGCSNNMACLLTQC